ncbi:MAG: glucoamylase family protein [Candidatus Binatia bacterium]
MSAASRYVALGVAVVCGAVAIATGARPSAPILKHLVLDDFEPPPGSRGYGILDTTLPAKSRGRIEWERVPCRRSGASGHCMRLRYAFESPNPSKVSFRIDLGDLDASNYDHLEFWVKGALAKGFSRSFKVGFRHPKPELPRLMEDGTAVVSGIGAEWRRIVVPLNRMAGIGEWKQLRAFFISLESRRAKSAKRGEYLIDDVALLKIGGPGPTIADRVIPAKKEAWKRSVGLEAVARVTQARLSGWPERLLVDRATLPRTNREFLERLARDTWRGLEALTDRENGLPVDNVILSKSLAPPDSMVGDYTNITNVGLHLIAVVAAYELGLVSAEHAVARLRRVLDTMDGLESHHGFYFNYYDTTSLERTSNFISFVDCSWLTAGLMVVRMTFPELRERVTKRLDAEDYSFFYDDVAQQMSHGYYVNVPTRSEYHYGVLYTEPRLGSLIAIGKGTVPEEHWFALVRTYPPEADWQTQKPRDWRTRKVRGHTVDVGTYEWKDFRYVPSWGGSMFEALMPALVVDEQRYAPKSLGRNDAIHAAIQQRYATEDLGYPVWGLSPSVMPNGKGYGEYGVKALGSLGYGPGAVAPYAAALALLVMPEEAAANLRQLAERYHVYGEYGFYDSVDPGTGQVATHYLALDQSMVLIALANSLKDHCIQKRFASDPIAERALAIIGEEDFFE